jgi:hypothetical protein
MTRRAAKSFGPSIHFMTFAADKAFLAIYPVSKAQLGVSEQAVPLLDEA